MFVINANSTQTLSINISDEYSLDYFLFALSGNGLTTQKLFFSAAILTNVPRCVGFSITENATEDLTTGVISLPLAGDLYCEIYNVSSQTLELPTGDPIWRGLFRVFRTTTTMNENDLTIEYKGYDPR